MPLKSTLLFLLQNLGHGKRSVVVSFQQMLTWENHVLPILLEERLLVETELATAFPCRCGEEGCLMGVVPSELTDEVTRQSVGTIYFGICGINNARTVQIEQCWLKQWQLTPAMLIDWLTQYLRLEPSKEANRSGIVQLGTLTLDGKNYALALGTADELVLLVNGNAVLISELFNVSEGGAIEANTDLIKTAHGKHKRLTPKRLDKKKRDDRIFEKYHEIKIKFPNLKSDRDVVSQLMKDKELVGNLTPETIRRILSDQKS
jgi:hypothetical protein